MLVTKKEFAEIKGVSPSAVTQACRKRIKDAIILNNGKEYLVKEKALELWDQNTKCNGHERLSEEALERNRRPAAPLPAVDPEELPEGTTAAAVAAAVMALPDDAIPGKDISEERKIHYQAEVAKVEALKARGEVGSIDAMKREAFQLAKAVREGMLGIIPRVSADLAALADPFEIERLLEAEMLTALRALSDG